MLLAVQWKHCKGKIDYFVGLLYSLDIPPGSLEIAWIECHLFMAYIMFSYMVIDWYQALMSLVIKKPAALQGLLSWYAEHPDTCLYWGNRRVFYCHFVTWLHFYYVEVIFLIPTAAQPVGLLCQGIGNHTTEPVRRSLWVKESSRAASQGGLDHVGKKQASQGLWL